MLAATACSVQHSPLCVITGTGVKYQRIHLPCRVQAEQAAKQAAELAQMVRTGFGAWSRRADWCVDANVAPGSCSPPRSSMFGTKPQALSLRRSATAPTRRRDHSCRCVLSQFRNLPVCCCAPQAALQREAEQRRAQLTRGLAALAEAVAPEAEAAGGAGGGGGSGSAAVKLAGPEDVARVSRAVSDYEVLQVRAQGGGGGGAGGRGGAGAGWSGRMERQGRGGGRGGASQRSAGAGQGRMEWQGRAWQGSAGQGRARHKH